MTWLLWKQRKLLCPRIQLTAGRETQSRSSSEIWSDACLLLWCLHFSTSDVLQLCFFLWFFFSPNRGLRFWEEEWCCEGRRTKKRCRVYLSTLFYPLPLPPPQPSFSMAAVVTGVSDIDSRVHVTTSYTLLVNCRPHPWTLPSKHHVYLHFIGQLVVFASFGSPSVADDYVDTVEILYLIAS